MDLMEGGRGRGAGGGAETEEDMKHLFCLCHMMYTGTLSGPMISQPTSIRAVPAPRHPSLTTYLLQLLSPMKPTSIRSLHVMATLQTSTTQVGASSARCAFSGACGCSGWPSTASGPGGQRGRGRGRYAMPWQRLSCGALGRRGGA